MLRLCSQLMGDQPEREMLRKKPGQVRRLDERKRLARAGMPHLPAHDHPLPQQQAHGGTVDMKPCLEVGACQAGQRLAFEQVQHFGQVEQQARHPVRIAQPASLSEPACDLRAQQITAQDDLRRLSSESGFLALTGSADLKELEARSDDEDVRAATAAFVQQACKAVGEQVGALSGRPDAIVVTGGIARWDDLMDQIERRLGWMAPVLIIPGELELEALAEGAGRVLLGLEPARDWKVPAAPAGGCSGT